MGITESSFSPSYYDWWYIETLLYRKGAEDKFNIAIFCVIDNLLLRVGIWNKSNDTDLCSSQSYLTRFCYIYVVDNTHISIEHTLIKLSQGHTFQLLPSKKNIFMRVILQLYGLW
jgi:hypothetical protein